MGFKKTIFACTMIVCLLIIVASTGCSSNKIKTELGVFIVDKVELDNYDGYQFAPPGFNILNVVIAKDNKKWKMFDESEIIILEKKIKSSWRKKIYVISENKQHLKLDIVRRTSTQVGNTYSPTTLTFSFTPKKSQKEFQLYFLDNRPISLNKYLKDK